MGLRQSRRLGPDRRKGYLEVEIQRYAWSDTGSDVPGAADILSNFTGVNLRTLDIALLMCYDEKQFLPWSCCLASCCYSPMRQPCGPGKARSSCAPSQFAGACKPKIPIGGMWKYQLDLVGLKEWDCGLVYYAVHPYVEGTGRKSLV